MPLPNFDVQKLMTSAKSFFGGKNESVIGLDIGSSSLKVVQVRKEGGRAVLETYGELALGPYGGLDVGRATNLPTDKLAEAIKDLFREANVTAKSASIALPLSSALLTFVELPSMEEDKLAKIISLEARKYIPVPINEVTLDWLVLPKVSSTATPSETSPDTKERTQAPAVEKITVMIVAIHNQVLDKYQEVALKTGLTNTSYEIEVYSSIRATLGHDMSPMMIIDIGAGITKVAMVEQGLMKSVHMVSRGSQEATIAISHSLNVSITKAEKLKREIGLDGRDSESQKVSSIIESVIGYIFTEANRILLAYQSKNNKTITKVILTGGGVLLKGLPEYVRKWLEADVVFGDSFSKLEYPAFLEPVLSEAGPEFSVAIGLALKRLQDLG